MAKLTDTQLVVLSAASQRPRTLALPLPERIRGGAAAIGWTIQIAEADRFAANVLPVIPAIQATGITSFGEIAGALNACGIPTARGGRWHVSTVRNALRRQSRSGSTL